MASLRDYLEKMDQVFDGIDAVGIGISTFMPSLQVQHSRDVVQSDLTFFSLYLSASDHEISYREKTFISENLCVDFTIDEMRQIISQRNIRSDEYEKCVPISVKMMVNADNEIVRKGNKNAKGGSLLYGMFKNVGQALLACDDEVAEEEIVDLSNYLNMIKNYINSESCSSIVISSNPRSDAEGAKKLLREIKPEYKSTSISTTTHTSNFGKADNPSNPAPWDKVYYDYACPYCGKYKVRPSKWEDKMWSTAFWGFYSYKLHCRFKCDACGQMWN